MDKLAWCVLWGQGGGQSMRTETEGTKDSPGGQGENWSNQEREQTNQRGEGGGERGRLLKMWPGAGLMEQVTADRPK